MQVLNLFNLEDIAKVAALSLVPEMSSSSSEEDDPVLQLANIRRQREKILGTKSADLLLRRKLLVNSKF